MNTVLITESLSKSYDGKSFALTDCNFSLEKGKICAVVGESGSGKSTLLRLIAGLESPTTGSITINGKIMSNDEKVVTPQNREVGMVFQDFALFPHLTVAQNIQFGLKGKQPDLVTELLQFIKMEQFAKAYPNELSGGQEQRVAIARTLARHPKLLLLDEPFSNLDAALKTGLRQEIRQIVKTKETTMLFITHDLADAIDIADEIIFLDNGNLIQHSNTNGFVEAATYSVIVENLNQIKHQAKEVLNW